MGGRVRCGRMDPNIRVIMLHLGTTVAEGVIPMSARPTTGEWIRVDDTRAYKVEKVTILYQRGLGEGLNPTLVEVSLS